MLQLIFNLYLKINRVEPQKYELIGASPCSGFGKLGFSGDCIKTLYICKIR